PRAPIAASSVLVLFLARAFFVGSFAHDSFFSQVVSELFAVAMWWAIVAWDERPSIGAMGLFAMAGVAAVLTWPVLIGPPVLALCVLAVSRTDLKAGTRVGHVVLAAVPIAVVAAMYIAGRAGWILIVRTSGAALRPSPDVVGWPFLLLATSGLAAVVVDR